MEHHVSGSEEAYAYSVLACNPAAVSSLHPDEAHISVSEVAVCSLPAVEAAYVRVAEDNNPASVVQAAYASASEVALSDGKVMLISPILIAASDIFTFDEAFTSAKAVPDKLTVPAKINPAKNVLCFTIHFPSSCAVILL